jgi:hypothetical protein
MDLILMQIIQDSKILYIEPGGNTLQILPTITSSKYINTVVTYLYKFIRKLNEELNPIKMKVKLFPCLNTTLQRHINGTKVKVHLDCFNEDVSSVFCFCTMKENPGLVISYNSVRKLILFFPNSILKDSDLYGQRIKYLIPQNEKCFSLHADYVEK